MRHFAAICLFLGALETALGCNDDGSSLIEYQPDDTVEKVNCAGGAKCAECCNDGACAVGQECNTGATEDGRVILFCDGPEDCASPKFCCIKQAQAGALVGSCADTCDGGYKACHVPANCGGEACGAFEAAAYVGVCGSPM